MSREEERNEAISWKKSIWLVRYTNPDGSCDPRCCGVCPALPCNRAAAFAPCRIVVGGFAGVGGYARLPGLLDDRACRNHSTGLWGDSKSNDPRRSFEAHEHERPGMALVSSPNEGEVGMSSQRRVSGTAVQRTIAVLGSAVFFVVAPCTLAGLVP